MDAGPLSNIIQLLGAKCTVQQIKDVLRRLQETNPSADILLGKTKAESLEQLRLAVQNGTCPGTNLTRLLQHSEEAGGQHTLILRPDPGGDPFDLSASHVQELLFSQNECNGFPLFEYPTDGFQWVDFRPREDGGWIAKAYGRQIREKYTKAPRTQLPDGSFQFVTNVHREPLECVLVARWRARQRVLELRVDNSKVPTIAEGKERRTALRQLLAPVLEGKSLIGVNFEIAMRSLLENRAQSGEIYSIADVTLVDPRSGQMRFLPDTGDELHAEEGRARAVNTMLKDGFLPTHMRLTWRANDRLPNPVTTVLEKTEEGPELRILKNLQLFEYEYLFKQLSQRFDDET